jgi:hypothetical protein
MNFKLNLKLNFKVSTFYYGTEVGMLLTNKKVQFNFNLKL